MKSSLRIRHINQFYILRRHMNQFYILQLEHFPPVHVPTKPYLREGQKIENLRKTQQTMQNGTKGGGPENPASCWIGCGCQTVRVLGKNRLGARCADCGVRWMRREPAVGGCARNNYSIPTG